MNGMDQTQAPYGFYDLYAGVRRQEIGEITEEERRERLATAERHLDDLRMKEAELTFAIRRASTEVEAYKIADVPTGIRPPRF